MLENLRTHSEEQTNDSRFAKALAAYADLYVNESFANSHREHASMVGIPKYLPSFAGLRLREEVEYLKQALHPQHPALFILGGAKFATKQPLAQKFLSFYDSVFIGGALANDFFKAQGYEVGQSLVSENVSSAKKLLSHPQLMLPTDVIVKTERGERVIRTPKEVRSAECILDAGPDTVRALEARIREARVVLWNGPLGNFEHGFDAGTLGVAKYLADNKEEKFTIVGGGDTIAVLERLRLGEGSYSFISTGGGAMLQFLASETLPALEALHT
jgi:phosphoglycerate kinase